MNSQPVTMEVVPEDKPVEGLSDSNNNKNNNDSKTDNSISIHDDEFDQKRVQFSPSSTVNDNNNSSKNSIRERLRNKLRKAKSCGHIDLATGRTTKRQQSIKFVQSMKAQSKWSKWKSKLNKNKVEKINEEEEDGRTKHGNYRIQSSYKHHTETNMLIRYLNWTFKASFGEVYLMTFIIFMLLIVIFAIMIYGNGQYQPGCVNFSTTIKERDSFFVDAFHLSWTTLSTVGYGVISPVIDNTDHRCFGINVLMAVESFVGVLFGGITGAIIFSKVARVQSIAQVKFSIPMCVRYGTGAMETSGDAAFDKDVDDDDENCDSPGLPCPILEFRLINLLSGEKGGEIMDASVNVVACIVDNDDERNPNYTRNTKKPNSASKRTSAVGKAAQTTTQMVGKAAQTTTQMVGKAAQTTTNVAKKIGSAGTKAATVSGKAAKNTGVALLGAGKRASNATGSLIQQLNRQLMGKGSNTINTDSSASEDGVPYSEKELEKELEKVFERKFAEKLEKQQAMMGGVTFLQENQTSVAVDEGNSTLAPPRTYHKLEIETDSHPFFKRMWVIRHVLNEQSPLLSYKARRMISENKGYWPESLNDHEAVRKNLYFAEIICSFSGTANASGCSVYAQKVYDFSNVNVGYTFANVLVKEKGTLIVDAALLNDVKEQLGGGAEPLRGIMQDNGNHNIVTETAAMMEKGVTNTAQTVVNTTKAATEGATMVTKVAVDEMKGAMTKTGDFVTTGISKFNATTTTTPTGGENNNNESNNEASTENDTTEIRKTHRATKSSYT